MKHTKEPWFAEKTLQGRDSSVSDMSGKTIAIAYKNTNISGDDLANAQRIVACVNACDDLTNKHLNAGVIYRLIALQGLVHFAFGVELNKESKSIDEIIKISNEIHKILVNGEDV